MKKLTGLQTVQTLSRLHRTCPGEEIKTLLVNFRNMYAFLSQVIPHQNSDLGTGQEDQEIRLSELIDFLNKRFGTDFTQADQLFFDQIQEEAVENEDLQKAAATNSKDDFRYVFEKAFECPVIDRMEGNEEIFGRIG